MNGSTLTGFGTGGPGNYELVIASGPPDEQSQSRAEHKVELGVEVRDGIVCFRDLYDLIRWDPECPPEQVLSVADGFYRVIACTSRAPAGQTQFVHLYFVRIRQRLELHFDGVPELC